jgi:hypothetical protein
MVNFFACLRVRSFLCVSLRGKINGMFAAILFLSLCPIFVSFKNQTSRNTFLFYFE